MQISKKYPTPKNSTQAIERRRELRSTKRNLARRQHRKSKGASGPQEIQSRKQIPVFDQ